MARSIVIQILGDASDLKREFRMVDAESDKLGKKLGGSFKKWAKLGAAGAAAGAGVIIAKGLKDSVAAAQESEKAEFRLGQAFDSAKVKARDRAKATAAINKVSRKAALDDEELSDVLAKLTRSTGSVQKGMEGMALAAEFARARDVPLATAAKAVEQAMLGKERGLAKLGVVVPKVTAEQDKLKRKIDELKDAEKKATGQRKITLRAQIKELEGQKKMAKELDKRATAEAALAKAQKQSAGAAERYGKTTAGAQERLSVAYENLQERIGMKLLPVLAKLAQWGVRFLDWSEKNWPRFSKAINDVWKKVKPIVDNLIARIKDVVRVVENVVRLIDAIAHGKWNEAWKAFKGIVDNWLKLIYHSFLELPGKVIRGLGEKAWSGLKKIGTYIKNAAIGGLEGLADGVIGILVGAINKVIGWANAAIGKINKVSPFPDIPKISEVGSPGSTSRTSPQRVQPGTRSSGPRDRGQGVRTPASATPVAVQATMIMDGREVGRLTLNQNQRTARTTAASRRGPHAGRGLALG